MTCAVHEHFVTSLGLDGLERQRLQNGNGQLDAAAIRRIAVEYLVNRGIRRMDDEEVEDINAAELACLINSLANNWPETLTERFEACAHVARQAAYDALTRGILISAVTKFMWFLQPDGWTMFDNKAAKGLGVNGVGVARAEAFYQSLAHRNFPEVSKNIKPVIKQSNFEHLYAERIIDKFLMLASDVGTDNEVLALDADARFGAMPEALATELRTLAENIANQFADALVTP